MIQLENKKYYHEEPPACDERVLPGWAVSAWEQFASIFVSIATVLNIFNQPVMFDFDQWFRNLLLVETSGMFANWHSWQRLGWTKAWSWMAQTWIFSATEPLAKWLITFLRTFALGDAVTFLLYTAQTIDTSFGLVDFIGQWNQVNQPLCWGIGQHRLVCRVVYITVKVP